jgi:hypothetical protein
MAKVILATEPPLVRTLSKATVSRFLLIESKYGRHATPWRHLDLIEHHQYEHQRKINN